MANFQVTVSKADFKFNCAHFIAYRGFRERMHVIFLGNLFFAISNVSCSGT